MKKLIPRRNVTLFKYGMDYVLKEFKTRKNIGCSTCICNMLPHYPKELMKILSKYERDLQEYTGCAKRAYALDDFFGLSGGFKKHCTTGLDCNFGKNILINKKEISFRATKI